MLKFDTEEETWSKVAEVGIPVEEIQYADGRLWLGGIGVMTADPEINDWLQFDASTGLPGNGYRSLVFGDDYHWLAADSGIARYDPIIEEWEQLSRGGYRDVAICGGYVFFAGDSGIYRYDKVYESWSIIGSEEGLKGGRYRWVEELSGETWFFGDKGIDIYMNDSRSWVSLDSIGELAASAITQVLHDGERLWILADGDVNWCHWEGRDYQEFPRAERLKGFQVREIAGGSGVYYFATDRGIMIYFMDEERWELIDHSTGLENIDLLRIAVVGQLIFARSKDKIEVYSLNERRFLPSFNIAAAVLTASARRWNWDERGAGGELLGGDARLKGTYSYISQLESAAFADRHRIQLYPSADFQGRRIAGFYDNTDPDELLYGAAFRGLRNDNLHRVEMGNRISYKLNYSELLGETTFEGAQGVIEYGSRSTLRGRRESKLDAAYGRMVTGSASDIFFGEGDVFYSLSHDDILPGSARIFINDEEIPGADYMLSNTTGTLNFTFLGSELLDENDKIQVDYQYLLPEGEGGEFAGGDLNLAQNDNLTESVSFFSTDSLTVGRAGGEFRAGSGKIEIRFIPEVAVSHSELNGEGFAGRSELFAKSGNLLFSANILSRGERYTSLDPALTEFGELRQKTYLQLGYESEGIEVYADHSDISGEFGVERTNKMVGFYSKISNLSLFANLVNRQAEADSLNRDHRQIGFGGSWTIGNKFLEIIRFRRLDIYGYAEIAITKREYPLDPDSSCTESENRNLYLKMTASPSTKVNLNPEIRLINKDYTAGEGEKTPLSRSTMFRGTANILDILPGVRHYFRWVGEYNRDKFAYSNRDVYFYREGYFSTEFLPGRWWDGFSDFNFGLSFFRSERDSLLSTGEDLVDLWNQSGNYSFFNASDVFRVTVFPSNSWEVTEVVTSSRGTGSSQYQSQSIVWWRGLESQVIARFFYIHDDSYYQTVTYNSNFEWYIRWKPGFLTRFSLGGLFKDIEGSGDEIIINPSFYFDRYIMDFFAGCEFQIRNDIQPKYREVSGENKIRQLKLLDTLNLNIKFRKKLIFRLMSSYEYIHNIEGDEAESNLELEIRVTVKF